MSTKKAGIVAVGLVGAAFLFAWVYWNYRGDQATIEVTNSSVVNSKTVQPVDRSSQPVTPDVVVDDLVEAALADQNALAAEEADELGDLEDGNALVNDLSNVYEDNE